MNKNTFADRIKAAMKENNMTQAELAEAAGLAQPTIWRLVNGKAGGSTKLVAIAKALGVNINWLSDGVGEMRPGSDLDQSNTPLTYSRVKPVNIYVGEEMTNESALAPDFIVTKTTKAYRIEKNTGVSEAPAGTLIVIDTNEQPGNDDIVYACVNNNYSVYKYVEGGSGHLSVDEKRVPLTPVSDSARIIGVVVYLSRELKRKK